ncbi:nucleotidase-related [Holotrichia oblita]|uniref:Nucleotidase-related n=1 Tax=Holotrichia oblita TaxID=644536 RepID=A0ACB9T7P6_HOLOL|nr:nucleotidase-related [Holotrichia oblita]
MNARLEESYEENRYVGGMERVSYVVREARRKALEKKTPPVIYLNAGDVYTDVVWRHPFSKKIGIELLNVLMPDAACFGSHDLDYGLELIRPFVSQIKFPVLAANLHFTNSTSMTGIVKPSIALSINGVKVGIIGYISPHNHLLYKQVNIILEDEIEAVKREAEKMVTNHVEIIIALGHSGIDVDMAIAQNVHDIDIVIGGLTNTFLWNGKKPHTEEPRSTYPIEVVHSSGKKTLVATTYGFTKYMGKLLVRYNDHFRLTYYKGTPIFLDESISKDLVVTRLLSTYSAPLKKIHDDSDIFGKSIVYLSADDVRDEESNLGNFIADAFVEFMALRHQKPNAWTDAPIALVNAGAIRKSVPTCKRKPNLTRKMLSEVLPFRQRIVAVNLLGAVLLETLENAVRSTGETRGGEFLQVSGIRVTYDFSKPVGQRVLTAKAYCDFCSYPVYEHINPNKPYSVLVNTFLANAGDGHMTLKKKSLSLKPIHAYELDIISEVLKLYDYIRPEREERILYANHYRRPRSSIACQHRSLFIIFILGFALM